MASDLRFGLQNPGETAYKAQSSNRDIFVIESRVCRFFALGGYIEVSTTIISRVSMHYFFRCMTCWNLENSGQR